MQVNNRRGNTLNTQKGRTNYKGYGKHIGLDEANKSSKIDNKKKVSRETFKNISECLKDSNLLKTGIRFFSGVTYKEVINGVHSLVNNGK